CTRVPVTLLRLIRSLLSTCSTSKEGYTYLLLPPIRSTPPIPAMTRLCRQPVGISYPKVLYAPLLNTLCSRILPLAGEHPVILDAGCGERYYTAGIRAA
ncbi:MAG: hypothetical protein ACLU38_07635, partial [Dysosmobacter sp.]